MDLENLKKERDELNTKTKKLIDVSKEHTSRVKRLYSKTIELKKKRDEENKQVREFKEKRDAINKLVRGKLARLSDLQTKIKEVKPAEPVRKLRSELRRLQWRVETDVLKVKEEEKVVKIIAELEAQLKVADAAFEKRKEAQVISSELDDFKKEAQAFHEVMLFHAKKSEEYHNEINNLYSQIKSLEPGFKEISDKITMARQTADQAHQNFVSRVKKARGERHAQAKAADEDAKKKGEKRDRDMRELAETLFKEFQGGKKLSTEEIQIIQNYT